MEIVIIYTDEQIRHCLASQCIAFGKDYSDKYERVVSLLDTRDWHYDMYHHYVILGRKLLYNLTVRHVASVLLHVTLTLSYLFYK